MFRPLFHRPPVHPRQIGSNVAPMNVPLIVGTAVAGVGIYTYFMKNGSDKAAGPKSAGGSSSQASKPGPFSSFGFNSLKVQSTEQINHDTKRVRFALPDPDTPSGLSLSSAVLAFSFPGGGWLPCVRPYTPTNDLGTWR